MDDAAWTALALTLTTVGAAATWLSWRRRGPVDGLRAAARHDRVHHDLVEIGLADGLLTPRTAVRLARELGRRPPAPRSAPPAPPGPPARPVERTPA